MRPPVGMPSMSKRAKRVLLTIVGLIVLAVLWFQFVGIWVDWEWYGEVGFREVYGTQFVTRVLLFLIAGLGSGAVVALALLAAYRSRPVFVPAGEVDPLSPYRTVVATRPRVFALSIAGLVGLICGLSAQGNWTVVQLFLHAQTFGQVDAQFGHDVGFYVFRLPFIQMIMTWLFVVVAIAFFAVLVTQYLFGGIRLSGPGRRISSQAAFQLSLLIGIFVLIKAVQYWFDRYDLLFSNRGGLFTGASYTDVKAVLPAKIILMVIAAVCAVGFVVGAFLRSIRLPAVALALLVLSSVLIGGVWPLILQQVVVNPNGITKEPPYIQRSIAATQAAYGLGEDKVSYTNYADVTNATPSALLSDPSVQNARLLDPNILSDTFTQRQQLQNFYGFAPQLNVDRYTIDGRTQDFIVALRELNVDNLQANQKNWINEHLVFTHGNGLVAAPANQAPGGYPEFTVSDVSNQGAIKVDQPRIYYGQLASNYAIVGSESKDQNIEYDGSGDAGQGAFTYDGRGGVRVGNLFQRLVFATEYGEPNFLFSSEINGNSKILYNRDPRDRVEKAAPFLTVDTKPYPAVIDGRIQWIVDGYTTAANFPYAQNVTLSDATNNSQTATGSATGQVNSQVSYIRNSVKATVDAYDGTVTLYAIDESDPVLKAWEQVFPGLVQPSSAVSPELRAHFKYPQDLFEVQRQLLARYHLDNPVDFFQNSNFWRVPDDPTESGVTASQPPYYQQVALPGQSSTSFQLTSVLTGFGRPFLSAYMAVGNDPDDYGKITVLQLPSNTQTPGPVQIQQTLLNNSAISQYIGTRQRPGVSTIVYGNLLTLPTSKGLLYIEPLYQRGISAQASPQLTQILVWFGNRVGNGDTVAAALQNASSSNQVTPPPDNGSGQTSGSSSPPPSSSSSGPTTSAPSGSVTPEQALAAINRANQDLAAAKQSQDLGRIGAATQRLEEAVNQYFQVAGTPAAAPPAASGSAPPTSSASVGG
ncbi:UPF0182 family membrane protein [Nakamurella endophytica]|nr:UPF0182 family protein [Nakamurella endophytica]